MESSGPGFTVLYRWRLKAGREKSFVESWTRLSKLLLTERGSLGSRLHKGADGLWYSYAQWPSADARTRAFSLPPVDVLASERMSQAIEESFPELVMQSVCDLMVLPTGHAA